MVNRLQPIGDEPSGKLPMCLHLMQRLRNALSGSNFVLYASSRKTPVDGRLPFNQMLRPFELARVQVVKIKELRVLVVSCAGIFEVFVELLVPLELIAVSL